MMSSKTKYAIRAALMLADQPPNGAWILSTVLAQDGDIPQKFLEAILVELRDAGIVASRRGPGGGHRLVKDPSSVMVGDIIRVVEGQLALTPCSSRRQFSVCADCVAVHTCRLRHVLLQARDAVAGVLDGCSLADMKVPTLTTRARQVKAEISTRPAGPRKRPVPPARRST